MENTLYQQELLEHYRYPRNQGVLENAQATAQSNNPSCGDSITIQICSDGERLTNICFQGKGCVISQAAASLLTELSKEKTLRVLASLTKDDMLALIGIPLGPTRLRCALLSLEALHKALFLIKADIQESSDVR
ncbi:iron-sulfur cluster assembly scaffold protein [Candidatus Dependentiae bacterium]|nr:iron-sulfur cluster assembly scaffold protein [Candidatus Dependentiae bacterium]